MTLHPVVKKKKQTHLASPTRITSPRVRRAGVTAGVTAKIRRALSIATDHVELPRGHVLFKAGDRPSAVYVVVSGSVKLSLPRRGSEGDTVVRLLKGGEMFETSAALLGQPHLVSATLVTKAKLARISTEHLLRAMATDGQLATEITRELSRTVHALLGQVRGSAAAGTGAYRLVTFLLQQLPDGVSRGQATLTLPASKRAIAARLQLTPEHLSRVFGRLVALGLVSVDGPHIVLRNVAQLHSYVGAPRASGTARASLKGRERRVSRSRRLLAR